MSATPPPHSPSPSVEPDLAHLSPSLPTQPAFKTPERKQSRSQPLPDTTPLARGSSVRQRQEGDTDRVEGYKREDYDDYIREDLECRVFVDFEVFMKHVLHVPDDWRTKWAPAIEAVKANRDFTKHLNEYRKHCNTSSAQESSFYKPLVAIANTILGVLSQSKFNGISSGIPQYYCVNDPKKLRGGVINKAGLSPDLVTLHEDCKRSGEGSLHWANPLHILEVKPSGGALCEGKGMPRLVVDGTDPILNHASPPNREKNLTPLTTSATDSESRKRPADGSDTTDQRVTKKTKTKSGPSHQVFDEEDDGSMPTPETQRQLDPAFQVCRYLLEMFSVPLLRSHATVGLVDRGRLQLYHANRSVILVSSAINFTGGDGLNKFIANIIAFHGLSFGQNGILDTLVKDNVELIKNPGILENNKVIQKGNTLKLLGGDSKEFTVTLGDVISRDPATVGRSTVVLGATCERWSTADLVVKISWPGSLRVPESDFLKKASEEAEKTEGRWATKHLPRVFYAKDVVFESGSTLESVASLFEDATFVNGKYRYERRALRIIVQERLHPLKSLSNVKDIGQVFVDVACIHRWLYDCPGILHRDPSLNNIMCRLIKGKVYGVLTDYDLSSWKKELETGYARTSQQRTGTPPYMAQELLKGAKTAHLYRHDIESLFYIMLMIGARHEIGYKVDKASKEVKRQVVMREGKLPYQKWFNALDYDTLGMHKKLFFLDMGDIELSPSFECFRGWLRKLQYLFTNGFMLKVMDSNQKNQAGSSAGGLDPFDDETLGGRVTYTSFIEPVRLLTGELEGLTIRYTSTVDPTCAAPADI